MTLPDLPSSSARVDSWLVQAWASSLVRVIESMTGDAPGVDVQAADGAPPTDLFWWEQTLSVATGATAWVGASTSSWREIGSSVLKAAGVDDDDEPGFKSTYQEVVSQSFSGMAQALTARLGREITCLNSREAGPGPGISSFRVQLKLGQQGLSVFVAVSDALVNSSQEPAPKVEERPASSEVPRNDTKIPKSLDLLLDVELPVSISFGRAQLPLKDVIKLTTGSIVELNRTVSEPVDIIVNNCVIARGQVVVVEGNFGVRIQQVISRQDRLRTLR